jgi:hypothetical protein
LRKFCNQLRRAEQKWAAAANTVASVDGALDTTRTREAEALAADQQAAATLQDEHIPSLQKLESAALAAQASAGKAVARILAGRHIRYRLTKSQASKTIAGLEQTLAKQGVSISELRTIAGAALRPRRTDLLRTLSRR